MPLVASDFAQYVMSAGSQNRIGTLCCFALSFINGKRAAEPRILTSTCTLTFSCRCCRSTGSASALLPAPPFTTAPRYALSLLFTYSNPPFFIPILILPGLSQLATGLHKTASAMAPWIRQRVDRRHGGPGDDWGASAEPQTAAQKGRRKRLGRGAAAGRCCGHAAAASTGESELCRACMLLRAAIVQRQCRAVPDRAVMLRGVYAGVLYCRHVHE
jgi:hypothetical protein